MRGTLATRNSTINKTYPLQQLGVLDTAVFKISVRGATLNHKFLVCNGINEDIMYIGLANQLKISYNAHTQKLCAIAPVQNSLVLHQQTLIPAQSASVITIKLW